MRFFATVPRPCSYLDARDAVSVFADPDASLSPWIYQQLAQFGFRRSGNDLYVPACPTCSECTPVRIPAAEFHRSRNQQRIWNRNRDLECRLLGPEYRREHFELYRDYLARRHRGGGMDNPTPQEYRRFLLSDWCHTRFLELRLQDRLAAVAVTDYLDDALSAVYTFFDPDLARRSLGTYAILRQLQLAQQSRRRWLYLGFWIPGSPKMEYKNRFRPLEGFRDGRWVRL
ncbi:MAG TPA: arginyltransferase [Gammaproteobacteria bacterium]|nr:arginyltransferase [Gammaproteobacteria bacterium]